MHKQSWLESLRGSRDAALFTAALSLSSPVALAEGTEYKLVDTQKSSAELQEQNLKVLSAAELQTLLENLSSEDKAKLYEALGLKASDKLPAITSLGRDPVNPGKLELTSEQLKALETRLTGQKDWPAARLAAYLNALKTNQSSVQGKVDGSEVIKVMFGAKSAVTGDHAYRPTADPKHPDLYTDKTVKAVRTFFHWVNEKGQEVREVALILEPCGNPAVQGVNSAPVIVIERTYVVTVEKRFEREITKEVPVTPPPKPRNWEASLGLDTGLEKKELEQRYHVILGVDTSPSGNGKYFVQLDCNITTTEGYKNAAGFDVQWDTPQGRMSEEELEAKDLELPAGIYTFTAIVTDPEGNQTSFPITCSVPGNNTVSSDALHESEEYSSKQTFRFAINHSFKSGFRIGAAISGTDAGGNVGFGKNGKHLFGSLDVGGIYNYNLKEVMAQVRAQAGVTLFEKLGLGVNGEFVGNKDIQQSKLSGILRYQPTKDWQFTVGGGIEQVKTKRQGKTQDPYYGVGISYKF